ncbi:hypothetical protein JEQ12_020680 [Ovis aries]|uniref:Ig-like domain-containing protein n=1 Tax=Ovis aries TaxID=9940 RepID=A0A836CPU6_SHEEP|nr:hypothetical protein JEQ12_020680 [Ovis aries]
MLVENIVSGWSPISSKGGLRAQSVTQPEDEVPVAEGDPVTVKCTYSVSGSPYLSWYFEVCAKTSLAHSLIDSYEGQEVNIPVTTPQSLKVNISSGIDKFPNHGPLLSFKGYYYNRGKMKVASLLIPPDRKDSAP